MVSRRALAPVVACGEATKPGLAPKGSLISNLREREGYRRQDERWNCARYGTKVHALFANNFHKAKGNLRGCHPFRTYDPSRYLSTSL